MLGLVERKKRLDAAKRKLKEEGYVNVKRSRICKIVKVYFVSSEVGRGRGGRGIK